MTGGARAVINLDVTGAHISRHIYGHFAEHLGRCIYEGIWVGEDSDIPNDRGIRLDVVEALKALHIPNLRWPGGCFADEYHWKDGIGPKAARPRMVNTHWGNVEENNHFGTHEFMLLCELLETEPYISGNVGSGTVEEMSQWVEYLTRDGDSPMVALRKANGRDTPWGIKFWGIGNETWGCGGHMRPEFYADLARQYSTYCRNHGDNKLYRIASGANIDDYAWTEALMKTLGDFGTGDHPRNLMQALSLHYYTHGESWTEKGSATEFGDDDYYLSMLRAQRMDELLTRHINIMDVYDPGQRIGLVVDEWGTWWNVEPGTNPGFLYQQNTMRDALVASLTFDIFHAHAHRVVMTNIAQTVNVLQAVLLTEENQLILTPTYHVFEMNKDHHDAALLPVSLSAPNATRTVREQPLRTLSVSASTKNGQALVSVTNLDAEAGERVELDLRGLDYEVTDARVLTAPRLQDHNTAAAPAAVTPTTFDRYTRSGRRLTLELPPHSFVTVKMHVGNPDDL
ncbi:MAG TPA: alpha-L-arabinofuranosidase C-terminal domain-containing protein [Propionibacteriaceae bacterium]|nr:alpha-L-arabinofuranosidase C-terminal domain-containing protein [Propionibacteriaceae bacterium]